jgi:hypothetical protein
MIGKKEKLFIDRLQKGGKKNLKKYYNDNYIRQLKFRLLKKRKMLTDDLIVINEVLDELQSL